MTKKLGIFLTAAAIPVAALILLVHTFWLLAAGIGLVVLLFLAALVGSPLRTGHVLDNLVSACIGSLLVVALAIGIQRHIDRPTLRSIGQVESAVHKG